MDLAARTRLQEELRRADRRAMFRAAAAEIAHELMTPLNVVQARAQLVTLRESDQEIETNVRVILDQVQKIALCLRTMVDAANGEGPRLDDASLTEICDEACQLVRPLAEARRVSLEHVKSEGPSTARVDRLRTLQVLTNVMANSVDAMLDGGNLEIGADTIHLDKAGDPHAAPGSYVRFTVRDRGHGFDIAALNGRLANTPMGTAPKLGFFVCRSVLKELGGWMTVKSEPGRGAEIELFVPNGGEQS